MEYCVYYDVEKDNILEVLPKNIDIKVRNKILEMWKQDITKEILKTISEAGEITAPKIKEKIGHSASTLHENIKKLEDVDLIETKMIYEGNKQKIIKPKVLCVTKNPKHKTGFQKFFQGLFVDSEKTKKIVSLLDKNPDKYFSIEEISIKTKIPADEIDILLSNWESQITRSLSDFLKEKPFEKKILYKRSSKKKK